MIQIRSKGVSFRQSGGIVIDFLAQLPQERQLSIKENLLKILTLVPQAPTYRYEFIEKDISKGLKVRRVSLDRQNEFITSGNIFRFLSIQDQSYILKILEKMIKDPSSLQAYFSFYFPKEKLPKGLSVKLPFFIRKMYPIHNKAIYDQSKVSFTKIKTFSKKQPEFSLNRTTHILVNKSTLSHQIPTINLKTLIANAKPKVQTGRIRTTSLEKDAKKYIKSKTHRIYLSESKSNSSKNFLRTQSSVHKNGLFSNFSNLGGEFLYRGVINHSQYLVTPIVKISSKLKAVIKFLPDRLPNASAPDFKKSLQIFRKLSEKERLLLFDKIILLRDDLERHISTQKKADRIGGYDIVQQTIFEKWFPDKNLPTYSFIQVLDYFLRYARKIRN